MTTFTSSNTANLERCDNQYRRKNVGNHGKYKWNLDVFLPQLPQEMQEPSPGVSCSWLSSSRTPQEHVPEPQESS